MAWGVAGYSSVDKVCGSCHADRDGMPWSDLRPETLWRHVPFSGAQFLAQCRYGHPVTDSRYWNKYFPRNDIMHSMDCKGLAAIVAGGVFHNLIRFEARLGANKAERLGKINEFMVIHYRNNPCSSHLVDLREENLVGKSATSDWICLHGPTVKAAVTRHLAPFIRELADTYFNKLDLHDTSVRALCSALDQAYFTLYESSMFLLPEQHALLDRSF